MPWTRMLGAALAAAMLYIPLGSMPAVAANKPGQPLKIGFLMVGPVADAGWNAGHDLGRQYMEKQLQGQITTTVAENIPESAEVERVMEKMIAQGNRLIFATSYGYLEPALRVAKRHPDCIVMHCGRDNPKKIPNVGSYGIDFGDHFFATYASGLTAGRMTRSNKIGYVAAHPVPPLLLALNAFAMGARSVNPKATVYVVWTNNWSDPVTEAEAAKGLIDRGCDVLAAHLDSTITVAQTAEKHHLYACGYHHDIGYVCPKGWLTGQRWDWGPLYCTIAKSILNHTWKPGNLPHSQADAYGKLSSFGKAVPAPVQAEAKARLADLQAGKLVLFKGPMKDRQGKERIPAGKILTNDELGRMDWWVAGIEGNLPKH